MKTKKQHPLKLKLHLANQSTHRGDWTTDARNKFDFPLPPSSLFDSSYAIAIASRMASVFLLVAPPPTSCPSCPSHSSLLAQS